MFITFYTNGFMWPKEVQGKGEKEGQPGIELARLCVSTRGPEALSQCIP
jgi:hypothetical protein